MDFNHLDQKHKRAIISHIKLFRVAVERLNKLVPAHKRQILIDELCAEAMDFVNFLSEEEVNAMIQTTGANLSKTIK